MLRAKVCFEKTAFEETRTLAAKNDLLHMWFKISPLRHGIQSHALNRSTISSGPETGALSQLQVEHSLASTRISFAFVAFIVVKRRNHFAIIAVVGNVDVDGKVEIDEMMRLGDVSEYTVEQRRQHLLLFEE